MADTLHLQIVTPDRLLVREDADQVQIPGKNGELGILPDKVTILADSAEHAEDIDVKRAQEAKARAEEALRQAAADLDYDATLYALRRAEARLAVAARVGQATTAH